MSQGSATPATTAAEIFPGISCAYDCVDTVDQIVLGGEGDIAEHEGAGDE